MFEELKKYAEDLRLTFSIDNENDNDVATMAYLKTVMNLKEQEFGRKVEKVIKREHKIEKREKEMKKREEVMEMRELKMEKRKLKMKKREQEIKKTEQELSCKFATKKMQLSSTFPKERANTEQGILKRSHHNNLSTATKIVPPHENVLHPIPKYNLAENGKSRSVVELQRRKKNLSEKAKSFYIESEDRETITRVQPTFTCPHCKKSSKTEKGHGILSRLRKIQTNK